MCPYIYTLNKDTIVPIKGQAHIYYFTESYCVSSTFGNLSPSYIFFSKNPTKKQNVFPLILVHLYALIRSKCSTFKKSTIFT